MIRVPTERWSLVLNLHEGQLGRGRRRGPGNGFGDRWERALRARRWLPSAPVPRSSACVPASAARSPIAIPTPRRSMSFSAGGPGQARRRAPRRRSAGLHPGGARDGTCSRPERTASSSSPSAATIPETASRWKTPGLIDRRAGHRQPAFFACLFLPPRSRYRRLWRCDARQARARAPGLFCHGGKATELQESPAPALRPAWCFAKEALQHHGAGPGDDRAQHQRLRARRIELHAPARRRSSTRWVPSWRPVASSRPPSSTGDTFRAHLTLAMADIPPDRFRRAPRPHSAGARGSPRPSSEADKVALLARSRAAIRQTRRGDA